MIRKSNAWILALGLSLCLPEMGLAQQKPKRAQIPSRSQQQESLNRVRKLYADQYKDSSLQAQRDLAKTLFELASERGVDLSLQYGLLSETLRICSSIGDIETAWSAAGELTKRFFEDELELRLRLVKDISTHVKSPQDAERIAAVSYSLTQRAINVDDYDAARSMNRTLASIAKKARHTGLENELSNELRELKRLQREFDKAEPAIRRVRIRPSDASANEEVGAFYCFEKGEFVAGLPFLANGTSTFFSQLAAAELDSNRNTETTIGIADRWLDHGSEEKNQRIIQHAIDLFHEVHDQTSGIKKRQIEIRLQEAVSSLTSMNDLDSIFKTRWLFRWENKQPDWTDVRFKKSGTFDFTIKGKTFHNKFNLDGNAIRIKGMTKPHYYLLAFDGRKLRARKYDSQTFDLINSGTGTPKK